MALSELTHRVGLMAGSAFMDDMFVDFARDLLGRDGFDHWAEQHPHDFSKLKCKAWEEAKLAFDGTAAAAIDPPFSLIRSLPDEVGPDLQLTVSPHVMRHVVLLLWRTFGV